MTEHSFAGARIEALIVMPTYNEASNLDSIVRRILAEPGFGVLVVDDASPDGTGVLADALAEEFPGRVEVIHRDGEPGLGRAYRDGLAYALRRKPSFIIQMDADWSHDPVYLSELIGVGRDVDLVIGSRYVNGISVVNWPLHRLMLSVLANRYVRGLTGLPVRDCTSGYRCWRHAALSRIDLSAIRSDGYSFLVELLFESQVAGCRMAEVPIIFVERRAGASKLTWGLLFEAMVTPWRLCMRRLLRLGRNRRQ